MNGNATTINSGDIDTLLLDMDGTVLDLAFDNHFWHELLPQRLAEQHDISEGTARQRMRSHMESVLGSLQWYCLDHWSEALDLDVAAIKQASRHRIGYLPGALEFLMRTRMRPMRVVVVTNAHPQTLAIKLRQTHLDRYVDAVYSSHDIGHPKESAEFWPRFESAADLRRDRSVLVDDSAAVVATARSSGLAGVVTITRPDSGRPHNASSGGPAVEALADLGAVLTNPSRSQDQRPQQF